MPKPVQPQIDFIKDDLLKVIENLEALGQKVINLNFKLNQHIKKGHIPNEIESNIGSRIVFDTSADSSGSSAGDN
jgi:protein tyrosine/serine phosphatase|tara:strand:+ start:2724 stop:2948 length:225 start_codon:yes stop_codon:yes gene_type:complete